MRVRCSSVQSTGQALGRHRMDFKQPVSELEASYSRSRPNRSYQDHRSRQEHSSRQDRSYHEEYTLPVRERVRDEFTLDISAEQ